MIARVGEAGHVSFVLRGVRVLDEHGGFGAATDIAVKNGRIAAIGTGLAVDTEVADHDFAGCWLLPGVIDAHVHAMSHTADLSEALRTPFSYRIAETLHALGRTLRAGVTTVRDAGGLDAGVRDAVAAGLAIGPRVQVSVVPLSTTGGHGDGFLPGPGLDGAVDRLIPDYLGRPSHLADGVDQIRLRVRENVRAGADWIKIFATGGVLSVADGLDQQQFTDDELSAAVDEARRRGVPVMAHAVGGAAIGDAVRAGVRSIEHGVYLTEQDAAEMAERGTTLVPTLAIYRHLVDEAIAGRLPADAAQRARDVGDVLGEAVRIAQAAGVAIALGSDFAHRDHHGHNLTEISLLRRAGLSPEQALLSATRVGAQLLGLDDDAGRLIVGHRFDAVVLDADPGDLSVFADPATVRGVFRDGRPVLAHERWTARN